MKNDMLIRLIEEFNSKNILLTLSNNEIEDNLLNYFCNSQKKVTILNTEIKDIDASNITIKNISLSEQLQLKDDFDLIILKNTDLYLRKEILILSNHFNTFPLTIAYLNEWKTLDNFQNTLSSYKLNNNLRLSFKVIDSNEKSVLLYQFDEKLNCNIESFLNNFDTSTFTSNNTLNTLYETQYFSNFHRSLFDRLSSKLYPISLLIHNKLVGGFKNALISIRAFHLLKKHDIFNVGYYLQQKPEILYDGTDVYLHYIYHGAKEGLKPSENFDGREYIELNPDLKNTKLNPLIHYVSYGKTEKRIISEEQKKDSNANIKGSFQTYFTGNIVEGWIAEIGNNKPIKAKVLIDNQSIEITADIYRSDLKQNGINEGNHGFKVFIPERYVDGVEHEIKLITMDDRIISTIRHTWEKPNYENNIQRYLAFSMTSPIISFPFTVAEKKILAVMENIANYLSTKVPQEKPLVSIIMPVYNREDLIDTSIQSVLDQKYDNYELIIIDDGSTDETINVIKKFNDDRIILLKNIENKGVSYSRNKGLKKSKGKYIMYLDSDNSWDERYIEVMLAAFNINKDADALYSGQLLFKNNRYNLDSIRFGTFNKGLLSNKNYIDLNAYAHTRQLFEKYGGFNEELRRFVDWDLILKYSTIGKTYSIPVILSNYYYQLSDNAISDDVSLADTLNVITEKHKNRLVKLDYNLKLTHGVSVIIPSYESLNDLKECLNSIFEINSEFVEIIVVDNNSNENVKKYLKMLESENKIKLILNNTNFGFTYAVNQGVKLSKKENDILLLNNDSIVTKNSIELLQEAAYKLDKCGMTVPQQILPAKTDTINVHVPYATENNEIDVNLSYHHKNIINVPLFHNGEYTELSFAPFFCVYIKRDVYDKSLGLDAELGRHYYSDMIFCNYVREIMGYKIYHVANARVYHKLQKSTFELEKKSVEQHNLLLKQNRWSKEEQEKYGFKQPRWDVDYEKFVDSQIIIKEYSLSKIGNIITGINDLKTVIIPIYNALEETRKCVDSVLKYTKGNYELLLINDGSTDHRIKTYLDEIKTKHDFIRVIHNQDNKGFVETVNLGLKNTSNDVILLNSDTIVTKNWLNKLTISAYQNEDIATVTPVSNNAGAFSVPVRSKNNPLPDNLTINQMAQIVEENSKKQIITTPTGNGFCMYIKRKVINDIGIFDEKTFEKGYGEENDFCMRAIENGWKNIVDDSIFIYHKGSCSFKEETEELKTKHMKKLLSKYPSYPEKVQQFLKSERFNNSCTKLHNTIEYMIENKKYKKILFVLHDGIGGSIYFTNELISKIAKYYECYLLLSSGSQITLKQWQDGTLKEIKSWNTNQQWQVDFYYMESFKQIYFNILTSLNVDLIHIQHLVKHSFDLIELIKKFEIPYIINIHDYYYICPSLNLLNDENTYCGGICNSTGQCDLPLPALNNAPILNQIQEKWKKINKELLMNAKRIIVPTNFVKEVYLENYPEISDKIDVIYHGQNLTNNKTIKCNIPSHNKKIKIVIPGNIGISKGALLYKQIKEYDVKSQIEFHFLGLTHESITEDEGILHGPYEHEDYPKLVEEINPSFTGIFSICPETFSFTLNESWILNIPVIASKMGALCERVTDGKTGWLVDLDAKSIYKKIIEISDNETEYMKVFNNIRNIKIKSLEDMIKDYKKIYSDLIYE